MNTWCDNFINYEYSRGKMNSLPFGTFLPRICDLWELSFCSRLPRGEGSDSST